MLEALTNRENAEDMGTRAYDFMREIFPICRSITGEGVRATLRHVSERIPLQTFEVPSGTPVFDWQVPNEWNIRDAWVKDSQGRRVIDFQESNLHLVSYSTPVRQTMTLAELRPRLHSLPDHPDWIPYRTSYYKPYWGFCMRHRDLTSLSEGSYEVCIDSTLEPGSLTYAECYVRGASEREVVVFTHICHPSLANDNASGIAVATQLASSLLEQPGRLSYRFVFSPGTIGAITWLARNEQNLGRIDHGLVLGLLGDPGPLTYKKSGRGDATVDRAARHVLASLALAHRIEEFSPYGYDERQFNSPGIDLPVGRLTRSPNDAYPQYHSSADDLSLVSGAQLGESVYAAAHVLAALDGNGTYLNMSPKCEPQLGKRGLYRPTGGKGPGPQELALLWVLNQANGARSLLDIAERSGIPFPVIRSAADDLIRVGLLTDFETKAQRT